MKLKDLFEKIEYARVQLVGTPCGWTNEDLMDFVEKENIPKVFEEYLNCEIVSISLDTYPVSGGYYVEDVPYLEITIK